MKKKIITILALIFVLFLSPNVKADPANDSFIDDELYKCVIDSYNDQYLESKAYTYSILPEELASITNLNCSSYAGKITSTIGLNKMSSLKSLNLSGNVFWGAKLTLSIGGTNTLKTSITLPSQLSLTDINYAVSNSKIAKIENGLVKGLSSGSTYVTMTGKVSGTIITEKYLIVVTDTVKKSNNGNLSSITLSYGKIEFKNNITKYTLMVPKTIDNIRISATLEDSNATFVSGYGPRNVDLKIGTNNVYLKVSAADGSSNVYTLAIVRSDGTDTNNLLSNIELSAGKIDFKQEIDTYSVAVPYETDRIEVLPVTESLLASTTVSDTNLKLGENKITISVKAENGNIKEYNLLVTREEFQSKSNYLSNLIITNHKIDFSKTVSEYKIVVQTESSLTINASPEKITSSVSIIGNKNLKDGSKVIVRVTDKDNLQRDYVIKISKPFVYNMGLKELFLLIEILAIIVLTIIALKPKNKGNTQRKYLNKMLQNKICPHCGTVNNPRSNTCYVCGRELI